MTWWQYLMLVNVYLLLFYGFYALLLSRETFFQLNRVYLVSAALLSFFIPVIQANWVKNLFITQKVQYTIYTSPVLLYRLKPIQDTHYTVGEVMVMIYLVGITFLMARFFLQLISLQNIIKKQHSPVAFSFFKKVKLGNDNSHGHIIAAHENVHASQWHSADVLMMEALMIINWFNPVVYLYRFAIKHIHEFIADQQALRAGTNKADYAMILLSQTFNAPAHQLVNPFFNKSLLKQRIMMLQKNKSHRIALIKYFLSAPLFILMLILSSATVNNSKAINLINKKVEMVLLTPTNTVSTAIKNKVTEVVIDEPAAPKSISTSTPAHGADITIVENDTTHKKDGPVFTSVEQVPEFPGGVDAFMKYLAQSIRYPQTAREQKVQGRVIISFIVEKDGSLSDIHAARGVSTEIDAEAIRVISASPSWKPGIQNGHPVRVAYSVPISFTLEDSEQSKPVGKKSAGVAPIKGKANAVVVMYDPNTTVDSVKTRTNFVINSYVSGLKPLYIVDERQVDNLNDIDPNTIESVTVLKDKSATALYGPNGANGVILIKTKRTNDWLKVKESPVKKN